MTVATTAPADVEQLPTVQQALVRVMRDVRALDKSDRNNHGNFNFRGIDATLNAIGPALRNHEVIVFPCLLEKNVEWLTTSSGRQRRLVTVTMRYTFIGPRGDQLETTVIGEAADDGDKGFSKAQSVAMRIALLQTFALPTQEKDPDAYTYDLSTDAVEQETERQQVRAERTDRQVRTGPPKQVQQAHHDADEFNPKPDRPNASTGNEQQWLDRLDGAADDLKVKTVESLTNAARSQLGEDHKVTQYGAELLLWVKWAKEQQDEEQQDEEAA